MKEKLDFALFCSNYERIDDKNFKHFSTGEILDINSLYELYDKEFRHMLISLASYNEIKFYGCDKIEVIVEYFDYVVLHTKRLKFKMNIDSLFIPIMEVKNLMESHIENNKELRIVTINPLYNEK